MPDAPVTPTSKNPFTGKSYDTLLSDARALATKVTKALDVAKCDKDPKTQRDVTPANDDAGQLLLALSAFKTEYAKAIRKYGGSDEAVALIKKRAGEARQALRSALKLMAGITSGLTEADEFLDVAQANYAGKHSDELEAHAARLEKAAQRALEEAKKIRSSKSGKRPKATQASA